MTIILNIIGWLFAALFGVFTVSMLLMNNWLNALVLILIVLLCLPPLNNWTQNLFEWKLPVLLRGVLIAGLVVLFGYLFIGGKKTSIYASPEIKEQFYEIYDQKMTEWPVPYEDLYLDTNYGKVHVIASGSEDAPPMLLLHASGVSSWSWKFNAETLSQNYRIYAIDLIGDAGKSEFSDYGNVFSTKQEQARHYTEIMDILGLEKAFVVGASEGGFISSNLALYYPERVEKLALMGPMGYAGAIKSSMRIVFTMFFPLKSVQESTFSWAFSDSPILREEYAQWFPLTMTGLAPVKVMPAPLSAEERQSFKVPVMFIFGEKDNLVGDPQAAKELVQDVPDVYVEIVPAGHLMGGEIPETCDQLLLDFFGE